MEDCDLCVGDESKWWKNVAAYIPPKNTTHYIYINTYTTRLDIIAVLF